MAPPPAWLDEPCARFEFAVVADAVSYLPVAAAANASVSGTGPSANGDTGADGPSAAGAFAVSTRTSRRPSLRRDWSLPATMCRLTVRTLSRRETAACSIVCQDSAMAGVLPWIDGAWLPA